MAITLKFFHTEFSDVFYDYINKYYKQEYKKIIGKKVTLKKCGQLLRILHQFNEWENEPFIKECWDECHQEQYFQFLDEYLSFVIRTEYRLVLSYGDLILKFPELSEYWVKKYLSFLVQIGFIYKKLGIFTYNYYAYKLNRNHIFINKLNLIDKKNIKNNYDGSFYESQPYLASKGGMIF